MRLGSLAFALATLVALAACDSGREIAGEASAGSSPPAAVACGDASQLRERAGSDRRLSADHSSDQEKIYLGSRANFYASLAIIAELRCRLPQAEVDAAMRRALDAARSAEETRSFYEKTIRLGEANLMSTEVIALLTQQLPAQPPG